MIYLDNAATTAIHPEVLEVMLPYLKEEYGNPSSKYYTLAENAKKAVENARRQVADLLGTEDPSEIIFTSGATESNNFVIKGVADFYRDQGRHIITSCVEHKAVLEPCRFLSERGYDVTYLPVDRYGRVNPADIAEAIRPDTILVSIMWGNNELGSLNDVDTIAKMCQDNNVFFHTDATQVLGKIPLTMKKTPANFLSFSAHKFHGPKGVGGCFIRRDALGLKTKLTPLLHGGEQELGYRGGTLAVHNIVGMGKAAELAQQSVHHSSTSITDSDKQLIDLLKSQFGEVIVNSPTENKVPGILSITIPGLNNELLCKNLAKAGIAIASGSACSTTQPSHVLESTGLSIKQIRETIRISTNFAISNIKVITKIAEELRRHY